MMHEIKPGQSSIVILKQIKGGGLDLLERFKNKCDFSFEAEKTEMRVYKYQESLQNKDQVIDKASLPGRPRKVSIENFAE